MLMIGTLEGRRDGWEALKSYEVRTVARIAGRPFLRFSPPLSALPLANKHARKDGGGESN